MASLIVQTADEELTAGMFNQRVLIGRKPFNGVQLGQRSVSRIHAWIDWDQDHFYIADAGSRGGTVVNGEKISGKVALRDGDEISIGPAVITFRKTDMLPSRAITFEISSRGTNPDFKTPGIIMQCDCGAPLWVPASMAGAYGKCAICKGDITVPGTPSGGVRRPLTPHDSIVDMPAISELGSEEAPDDPLAAVEDFPRPKPTAAAKQICGICQSPISGFEAVTTCPACSQTYHAECWRENQGCAAYGCSQTSALDHIAEAVQAAPPPPEPELAAVETKPAGKTPPFPWDLALLGGSVLGSIIGAFTFGIPALALGVASATVASRRNGERKIVAALAMIISAIGGLAGILTSRFWWFNTPLWGSR